jgi:hypothetical protein
MAEHIIGSADSSGGGRHQAEVQAAAYYGSVEAYRPFDIAEDGRLVEGCIDPRPDQTLHTQHTKVQGPGGAVGEADDHATALSIVRGRIVPIEEAAAHDMALRGHTVVPGAHRTTCAYVESFAAVKGEQAAPMPETIAAARRWIGEHNLGRDGVTLDTLETLVDHAAMQYVELKRTGAGVAHVVNQVDARYPDHHNVPDMHGPATPAFYIVNGYPHLGLNRHAVHDVHGLTAQAYHDSLRARIDTVRHALGMSPEVRAYRLGALLLRSAATRTVIDRVKREAGDPLRHIEVHIGNEGPAFSEVTF